MSEPRASIVVVGAHAPGVLVRVEHIPTAGETVLATDYSEPLDGGKGSNQAIAAARLGGVVSFIGRIGVDRRGAVALSMCQDNGVDTTYLLRTPSQPTGSGVNLLDKTGTPAMVTVAGANSELSEVDVDFALAALPSARVLLVQLEIPVTVALHSLAEGKKRGLFTVLNAAPASAPLVALPRRTIDLLVVNESEARTLLGLPAAAAVRREGLAAQLRQRTGIATVLVTLGERGVFGHDHAGGWHTPSYAVPAVDTSGAGDVFCAALAVRLAEGSDVREGCRWAALAAAASVTKPGTIESFPRVADVQLLPLPNGEVVG